MTYCNCHHSRVKKCGLLDVPSCGQFANIRDANIPCQYPVIQAFWLKYSSVLITRYVQTLHGIIAAILTVAITII
jgi:hypothetical protein